MAGHVAQVIGFLRDRMFFGWLVVVSMGLTMSLIVMALGKPWREERVQLKFRDYLFKETLKRRT